MRRATVAAIAALLSGCSLVESFRAASDSLAAAEAALSAASSRIDANERALADAITRAGEAADSAASSSGAVEALSGSMKELSQRIEEISAEGGDVAQLRAEQAVLGVKLEDAVRSAGEAAGRLRGADEALALAESERESLAAALAKAESAREAASLSLAELEEKSRSMAKDGLDLVAKVGETTGLLLPGGAALSLLGLAGAALLKRRGAA